MEIMNISNFLFSITDKDCHYVIKFLGIKIKFKHGYKYICPVVKSNGVTDKKRSPELIVSLTSFPARINSVEKTIRTLLTQTLKPDRVILWLAEEQFPNKENDLPRALIALKHFGLEIEFCEDLRSYKKLIPTLKKYPQAVVITTDDDIYYASDTVETLYTSYLEDKMSVHAHRVQHTKLVDGDKIKKCGRTPQTSYFNRQIGYGAVLYPPDVLYKDVADISLFKRLLPTHDDVWFWAMTVLNHRKIKVVKGEKESVIYVENTQQHGLCKVNKASTKDSSVGISIDEAYKRILEYYPQILDVLKEENAEK